MRDFTSPPSATRIATFGRCLFGGVLCSLILSCSLFDSGTPWTDGKYVLQWIDIPKDVTLSVDRGSGAWEVLVGSQVYAVGSNARYIVAKQHPGGDRSKTHFYVVHRQSDSAPASQPHTIIGPLSSSEFSKLFRDLDLPVFSKKLDTLE